MEFSPATQCMDHKGPQACDKRARYLFNGRSGVSEWLASYTGNNIMKARNA